MPELIVYSISVFTGFFAIMNPIANIPIFLGLTEGHTPQSKKKIAKKATITAFFIITVFIISGKFLFELFHITIPAFKITGGILIFYIGFEMLLSKKSEVQNQGNHNSDDDIAISPLSIPILAGPGTIVTAMNFVTHQSYLHIGIVISIFALMALLTYLAFTGSEYVVGFVGKNLIKVTGKIMGLILAIIGMTMIVDGIKLAFQI